MRGVSLLRMLPFSLSTFRKSWGIPSAPLPSSVGKSAVNSGLIGSTDLSKAILVAVTSAIEAGELGTKSCLNFCKVEKFLYKDGQQGNQDPYLS